MRWVDIRETTEGYIAGDITPKRWRLDVTAAAMADPSLAEALGVRPDEPGAARRLRDRIEYHFLSLGCHLCEEERRDCDITLDVLDWCDEQERVERLKGEEVTHG